MQRVKVGLWALFLCSITGQASPNKLLNFHSERDYESRQLIVHFQPDVSVEDQNAMILQLEGKVLHRFRSSEAVLVEWRVAEKFSLFSMARAFAALSEVQAVEPNIFLEMHTVPNDPGYEKQYGHEMIKMPMSWDYSVGDPEIIVGVIDTGIDYEHPDLAANVFSNAGEMGPDENGEPKESNGIDDDGNGYIDDWRGWNFAADSNDPMDDHGHGTHCAGVIGAVGDNETGIAGVNWRVKLLPLRFITAQGRGRIADAARAIEYATMMNVTLTSNSYGSRREKPDESPLLIKAIEEAERQGILFVASVGNDFGRDLDVEPSFPAAYEMSNIIAVASSDQKDRISFFSNVGKNTVDLFAPGSRIFSTFAAGGRCFDGTSPEGYCSVSGTSMAAPYVAGALALLKAHLPEKTGAELKERIFATVDRKAVFNRHSVTGGRLNVARALEADLNE